MSTVKSRLRELPNGYRQRALRNYNQRFVDEQIIEDLNISLTYAVKYAFLWRRTPEGHEFWRQVAVCMGRPHINLPTLPEGV